MDNQLMQKLILGLLEPGIFKTTAQIVEEFRMENPTEWSRLEKEGEELYGSGCSSLQQPATCIAQVLLSLPPRSRLMYKKDGLSFWSKS